MFIKLMDEDGYRCNDDGVCHRGGCQPENDECDDEGDAENEPDNRASWNERGMLKEITDDPEHGNQIKEMVMKKLYECHMFHILSPQHMARLIKWIVLYPKFLDKKSDAARIAFSFRLFVSGTKAFHRLLQGLMSENRRSCSKYTVCDGINVEAKRNPRQNKGNAEQEPDD